MQQINRGTRIREVEEKIIIYIYGSSVRDIVLYPMKPRRGNISLINHNNIVTQK